MAAQQQAGGEQAERLEAMGATEISLEAGRGAFLREAEAVIARKRYPAGALMPTMTPIGKPEDPVQRILRDGDRLFLSVAEAARLGEVSTQTIINLLRDGSLRGYRFGRRRTLISLDSFTACFRPWQPAEDETADEEADVA